MNLKILLYTIRNHDVSGSIFDGAHKFVRAIT